MTRARPGVVAGGLALAWLLASAPRVRAGEGTARDVLCLQFDGPWPLPLAALVDSDLRTAFGRRNVTVCPKEGLEVERETTPLLTLVLESEAMDRVDLTLDPRDRPQLERRLHLTPFPVDGRVLALVVAADELLQASREHPETAPPPPPSPPVAPERKPTVVRAAPPPVAPPRQSLAVGFAMDRYAGGQTHLGPDLTWRLWFTDALFVSVAGQARRGLTTDATYGTVASRLVGGRLALGGRLYRSRQPEQRYDRLALTADVGVRGGRIWFEGETATEGVADAHSIAGWLAYADAALALDLRLAGRLMLRLGIGAGAPLVGQAADDPMRRVTAAWGLALAAQGAVLMVF